jgi:hypothetical protein
MALRPGNGGGGNGERDPRLDLLYRDSPRDTPPPHLDAAILAAARREVGARPRALSALRRWRVPVSIAAIVVLSVSLVILVREEGGETLLREGRAPVAPPAPRVAESAPQPAEAAKVPEAGERLAASPDARKRAAPAPEELALRRDEVAATAAGETRRAMEREPVRSGAESAPRAGAPAGPDPAAAAPPAAVSGALSYQLRDSPARAEADAAQKVAPSIGIRGLSGETERPAAAPQAKPKAEEYVVQDRARPLQRAAPAPAWRGLEQEPPQKWLERLAELRKQQRTREADELLAEFKRRFPGHPLPAGTE